jgi:hypothetical protein
MGGWLALHHVTNIQSDLGCIKPKTHRQSSNVLLSKDNDLPGFIRRKYMDERKDIAWKHQVK